MPHGLKLGEKGDPAVIVMFDYWYETASKTPDFWGRCGGQPVLIVVMFSWAIGEADRMAERWRGKIASHESRHPGHRIAFAANAPEDVAVLREAGLEAIYCNHNAFVDERVFCPGKESEGCEVREFDAVYDARLTRFKRHPLAAGVRRLALVHYFTSADHDWRWVLKVRWRLRHARIMNRHRFFRPLQPVSLSAPEVAAVYRRAKTGLCLSAGEGAMLASMQYLLVGLPVVTTPSRGGRDVFFDEANSITVEPDTGAVARAVDELIGRASEPAAIRGRALERIAEHRARFLGYAREFQARHGVPEERRLDAGWECRVGEIFRPMVF